MKKILLLLITLTLLSAVTAKPVDEKVALKVAERFFAVQMGKSKQLHKVISSDSLNGVMYVFATEPVGFVVVSADDNAVPILGYSTTSRFSFDDMPPNVAAWFNDMRIMVEYARDSIPMPNASKEWKRCLSDSPIKDAATYNPIQPMLTTKWNQYPYYNSLCPINPLDSAQALVGCVAVAMGQIMKYWNYPQSGRGAISYSLPDYGTISANLDSSVYRWNDMPDSLTANTPDTQVYAVAKLLYDVGVAVHMVYGNDASGSQVQSYNRIDFPCAENALRSVFGYSQSLRVINLEWTFFSTDEWKECLRNELQCGRPVLYSGVDPWGGGHAFVLDGYDSLGMFHMNFGWGGYYDGYYLGHFVSPGSYNFVYYRTAIVGISPSISVQDSVFITVSVSDTNMGRVDGSGIYASYSDTVLLLATAYEGYKFIGWDDGCMYNPRTFIPNEDGTFSARFAKIDSTHMSYCHNYSYMSVSFEDSVVQWGVRIPASSLQGLASLKSVSIHITKEGDYTFVIYQGGESQPEQEVYRSTRHFSLGWFNYPGDTKICQLDSLYQIDHSRPLWITIIADSVTAAGGYYCGNRDGMFVKGDNGWYSLNDSGNYYSWIILADFYPRTKYRIEATIDIPEVGYINGVDSNNYRYYYNGDTATLTVVCNGFDPLTGRQYEFVNWDDGSTENPYSFVVDRQKTLVAHVRLRGNECLEIVNPLTPRVSTLGLQINVDCNAVSSDIEIYDAIGRLVCSGNGASISATMPSTGVYLVKIVNEFGNQTVKVVCWK